MFKLTVITINYNDSAGLERTVKSVVSQNFSDFEYIVIDGGSTDGSVDVIKRYADKINYWVSEKDAGIYNAMNKGIIKANGEYCLFLNSGDQLLDDTVLSKVFATDQTADILYGELIFEKEGKQEQPEKRPAAIDAVHLFHDNIWHPASFIRRTLFINIGLYNEKYKITADYDFFFHAFIMKKVSGLYLPFAIAIHDASGVSTAIENIERLNAEREEIHRTYLEKDEITYLENLKKFKSEGFAKWLVNKPGMNKMFDGMLSMYSKWRR